MRAICDNPKIYIIKFYTKIYSSEGIKILKPQIGESNKLYKDILFYYYEYLSGRNP